MFFDILSVFQFVERKTFFFWKQVRKGEKLRMAGAEGVAFGFKRYKQNDDLFRGSKFLQV